MASVITVTLPNGSETLISVDDLVFATDNGNGSDITHENLQTLPRTIQVTESLSEIEALDSSLLIFNRISPAVEILLNAPRIKLVEEALDFRKINYEGVASVNTPFNVSETISDIASAINSAGSSSSGNFEKVASLQNFDLTGIAGTTNIDYLPGKDGTNISNLYYVITKSNNIDVYGGDGSEDGLINFNSAAIGTYTNGPGQLTYGVKGIPSGIVSLAYLNITTEKFSITINTPMLGGTFKINIDFYVLKTT